MTKAPAATPRGTATACPPLYLLDAIGSLRNRATRNSDILSPVLFILYKAGPGGPIAADEVHLPLRAGPPALRARRPHPLQVEQSFARALEHLGTDVIDSYLLHGPSWKDGLAAADWEAWRAMEALHEGGRTRLLGVSNFTLEQLQRLCEQARVPPRFVQNRCYASRGWDRGVREFCAAHGMIYQGFSLLTANRRALAHKELARIALRHGRTASQIVFRFALEVGMIPLTGTSDAGHMREDLDVLAFRLDPEEVERIERVQG